MSARSGTEDATVWALLLGSSLIYFFSINAADNDLWGHVLFGRDWLARGALPLTDPYAYTTAGRAWVNHEWLTQVVFALVFRWAGSPGLLLLKFGVASATFVLLLGTMRLRTSRAYVWGAVGLLTVAVLARGFAIRPQIVTYCGVAATLALLDAYQRGHRHAGWVFPVMFVVWANLHGGFALGLAILGLFATSELIWSRGRSLHPCMVLLASVAATALNPFGPRLLVYIWNELSRAHPITEWQAAVPSDAAQFVFFAMLGLLVPTLPFGRRWREDGSRIVLALGVGVLALRHQRHTPVFALCAAAPLAAQLDGAVDWLTRNTAIALSLAAQRLIVAALFILAALQVTFTGLRLYHDGLQIVFDPTEYPTAAVKALEEARAQGNLAVPLDWGEYVLWFLTPQVKVSLDGRFATVFPEQVVEDNFTFFRGATGWRRLIDDYPTEAVLLPANSACPIQREPGWLRVYSDPVAEIYVRADRAPIFRTGDLARIRAPGVFP